MVSLGRCRSSKESFLPPATDSPLAPKFFLTPRKVAAIGEREKVGPEKPQAPKVIIGPRRKGSR